MEKRREIISWTEFSRLIDHLLPQFEGAYDAIVAVNRGGIIPAGALAEAMDISQVHLVSIHFPLDLHLSKAQNALSIEWPVFTQYPALKCIQAKRVLLVSEHWHSGREILATEARLEREGFRASTCVLHFDPSENILEGAKPDYYAARTMADIIYPWQASTGFYPKAVPDF